MATRQRSARRRRRYDEEEPLQLQAPSLALTGATSVRTPPPLSRENVARLQRSAGNQQVTQMIARSGYRDEELLAEEYAKDAETWFGKAKERGTRWWGDTFGKKKEPDLGPDKLSGVMDDSLKVAKYVDDGLKAAKGTLNMLAGDIPSTDGRKQLKAAAEHFGDAAEKLGKATETIDWVNDKIELYEDVSKLVRAIQVLRKPGTSAEEAAVAFDSLFAAAGKLGGKLPDGPWQAYFGFLEEFESQGGFFAGMIKKFMPANRVSGYDAETRKLFETNRVWDTVN